MRRKTIHYERNICMRKRYGFWAFIFDVFMSAVTSGLWLIWIFVREMRNR